MFFLEGIAAWQELIAWSWAASPSLQQRLWPATAPKSIFVHKMWLSYVLREVRVQKGARACSLKSGYRENPVVMSMWFLLDQRRLRYL